MILVGDLGATKVRLALCDEDFPGSLRDLQTYSCRDFDSFEAVIQTYLKNQSGSIKRACFGVPGPIEGGEAKMTNLPWVIRESSLETATGIDSVRLVNDLVAMTSAIPFFFDNDIVTLYPGSGMSQKQMPCAVLAPGTGCGQGYLTWENGQAHAHPSEGGHADFGPTNAIEVELYQYLQGKFGRVSYERILCGPGLVNIFDFLRDCKYSDIPPGLVERIQNGDAAAAISNAGLAGEFEICVRTLDIFVSILGAQAGNLVLAYLATGGLYLGGGIPPKILDKLVDGILINSYLKKGRLSHVVEKTPLHVIKDDRAALFGAAYIAIESGIGK